MTINEAIADLSSQAKTKDRLGYSRQTHALNLAIEALQRLCVGRNNPGTHWNELLPGETKD